MNLPKEIEKYIENFKITEVTIGCTEAKVFKCTNDRNTYYLKIDQINEEFTREQQIYHWLYTKLRVPEVIASCSFEEMSYLLLTEAKGKSAVDDSSLEDPIKLVEMLAKGIKELSKVDIRDCPFDSSLDYKLKVAKERIDKGLVELDDSDDYYEFATPMEIYNYLVDNKPDEQLTFVHGDYCFPNIFIDSNEEISFIDLGRAGVGDIYQDIALCIRSLRHNYQSDKYMDLFIDCLGIKCDHQKVKYYILLDNLF